MPAAANEEGGVVEDFGCVVQLLSNGSGTVFPTRDVAQVPHMDTLITQVGIHGVIVDPLLSL
jgi:hypothetical protein